MPKNDRFFSIAIRDMTNLGYGVADLPDGKTVFVKNAVRGDIADISIIKEASGYSVARMENATGFSPFRKEVDCPCYKTCGGCVFRHVDYSEEQRVKTIHVIDAFRKYAALNITPERICTYSVDRYRNNVRYPVGMDKGKLFVGFYHERSHNIIRSDDCPIQKECITPVIKKLLSLLNYAHFNAYDEASGKGYIRYLCVRCNKKGNTSVCLVINGTEIHKNLRKAAEKLIQQIPAVTGVYVNYNTKNTNVIFGEITETVVEKEMLTESICGRDFFVSPRSFFQVNSETAEMIYAKAKEYLGNDVQTLIDLYCGTGAVGICAVDKSVNLYGCEIIPEAVEDAKKNAVKNGFSSFVFECCDASEGIKSCERHFGKADAITVDPPRKGLSEETVIQLGKSGINKIVYISCNPDTLARDVKGLAKYGYTLKETAVFDMFPRTSHVETVCLLTRNHTVHYMKLNTEPFQMIYSGQKTIELRLLDEKMKKLNVGDTIVFSCDDKTDRTVSVHITALHYFKNFEELYQNLPLLKCGYSAENVSEAHFTDMEAYYSVEEQQKYGVVGIEISQHK